MKKLVKTFLSPEFIKFVLIGLFNTFNGTWISYVLSILLQPNLAFIVGYIISLMVAYFLNAWLNFKQKPEFKAFIKFAVSYIPNFIIQNVVVLIFYNWLGWHRLIAYALAAIIGIPVTFLLVRGFAFKKKESTFYTVIPDNHTNHTDYEYCEYKIKWNVERIIDAFYTAHAKLTKVLNGYIVQLVHFTYVDGRAANYYEAWEVTNGKTVSDGYDYDDNFSNGLPYGHDEDVPQHGVVSWKTKVYWVPEGIDVYDVVNNWKKKNVPEANELKAELEEEVSQDIKDQIEQNYVFSREYEHKW